MEQNESLTVLLIEPERYPKVVQIGSDLKSLQQAVGGWIEAVYPWEDKAAIILNEEGKINQLPLNRALRTEDGEIYDITAGNMLVVGLGEENFTCNGVQREHNKKLNNGLPILHKVPPKRDYGRYFCIMAEKGGTSHGGLTEKLSPFFHAKKQEVNAYGR